MMKHPQILSAAFIACGIALAGFFVFRGLASYTNNSRVVSVRGLAEREVKADHVTWPIVFKASGDDLQELYGEISAANQTIRRFLEKNGIPAKDISIGAPKIKDRKVESYTDLNRTDRFAGTTIVTVSSNAVDKVGELQTRVGELVQQGIVIDMDDYENTISFEFTKLNDIKPAMIEEATKNARTSAEKFAKDSGSDIGQIKTATQGYFEIKDRDQYTPHIKSIRVVTNVDYFVED